MKKVNKPVVLLSIGVVGFMATVGSAIYVTPKAYDIVHKNDINNKKKAITLVKLYAPSILFGSISLACFLFSHKASNEKILAATAAYAITDKQFTAFREKVKETLGEKKEQKVVEELAADKVKKAGPASTTIIMNDDNDVLCLDSISGRYFYSNVETIKKAENEINAYLYRENYYVLNCLYDILGLDHIKIGEDLGWNVENGLVEFDITSTLTEDMKPCLVLDYKVGPMRDFRNWY